MNMNSWELHCNTVMNQVHSKREVSNPCFIQIQKLRQVANSWVLQLHCLAVRQQREATLYNCNDRFTNICSL